ncbi:unnamed protein product [Leuciscus chuanchicus]
MCEIRGEVKGTANIKCALTLRMKYKSDDNVSTVRLCDPWGAAARDPPAGFGESKWDSSAHLLAAFCPQEIQNICPFRNVPANSHHTQRASHYCAHTHPRVLTFNDNPTEAVEHKKQVLLEHHILVAMLAWMVRSQSHGWRKPESPVPIRRIGCVQQLLYPGLGEDAARTENAEKVALQPLPESLPLQSAAADAGPAHCRLTHGDALTIVHRPA